ncbi:MAG: hypothetical protein AAB611_01405, partial [Patescibacteria group bacterium]
MRYKSNESLTGIDGNRKGVFVLEDIKIDQATFRAYCTDKNGRLPSSGKDYLLFVGKEAIRVCDVPVKLERLDSQQFAKVRLVPKVQGTRSESNFSVRIGIEKRAIQLSPDKALQKIENLNKSIEKWESISEKLGKVVEGMKTACFGTAAALTFKNFLSGLSGGTIARQQVMSGDSGWRNVCSQEAAKGTYVSIDACYLANADKIENEVSATTEAINKVNDKIKPLQDIHTTSSGIFGKSVNTDALEMDLAARAREDYKTVIVNTKGLQGDWGKREDVTAAEILSEDNVKRGLVSTEEMRSIMLYSELKDSGKLSDSQKLNIDSKLRSSAERINNNRIIDDSIKNEDLRKEQGLPPPIYATAEGQRDRIAPVILLGDNLKSKLPSVSNEVTHVSSVVVSGSTK